MKRKSIIINSVIVLLSVALIVYLIIQFNFEIRHFSHWLVKGYMQNFGLVKKYIKSLGEFAVIAFIIIFVLRTFLLIFPYSVMVIFGGSVFGWRWGFLFSMIAVFLSATMAYFISKYLGKEFVQKLLRGKLKQLDSKVEEHGFKIILFMRLSTVFPYDILNYAAGLTKIKYRDFILGTLLGMTLETFSLNFLGANAKDPFSPKFKFAVILILLTIAVPVIYNKFKKKAPEKS
jgi:uncharacterized membrane protein YdjX (TVP38/TMEM64 family)